MQERHTDVELCWFAIRLRTILYVGVDVSCAAFLFKHRKTCCIISSHSLVRSHLQPVAGHFYRIAFPLVMGCSGSSIICRLTNVRFHQREDESEPRVGEGLHGNLSPPIERYSRELKARRDDTFGPSDNLCNF